ncbi:ER membrane protein complex subunit 3 [Neolecta irregularis DAH-3]|uniref:ER membrane protein complex subunit 3 n=1 Tax=Neolecta irregularis (strain DAH-3) TaxID=1198029 RepID=A0A1U7LVE8_NEOID|nr:ER membrane protein complex subunit 3 [Neolecta irregularis DAH-3]|eukprot:OLL26491.1 ER membrane protein complex subunit 3 [Neolecta irregularis DAH-3]
MNDQDLFAQLGLASYMVRHDLGWNSSAQYYLACAISTKETDPQSTSGTKGSIVRNNANHLPPSAFETRKRYLATAFHAGTFLKDPESKGKPPANPMTDPAGMDAMLSMMKGNMANMVPQAIIMSWINFFFTGFILIKLPFPLTIRFKSMLQSGIRTGDLDARWVSSLSWYFLNLFGLRSVYSLILGDDNAADMQAMSGMAGAAPMTFAPGQDPHKMFVAEADNLELVQHEWILNGIETRILEKFKVK